MLPEIIAAMPVISGITYWAWDKYHRVQYAKLASTPSPQARIELPPAQPWTREDAAKAATLYREVPSAFWLAPEHTGFDGPPELLPAYTPRPKPPAPVIREAHRLPLKLNGREVVSYARDEQRMGWRFQLKRDARDISDPWMFMSDAALADWRVSN